ncbi:MAG: hypothetical protein NVSMB9_14200 [Isosphaeraceae bacterium]
MAREGARLSVQEDERQPLVIETPGGVDDWSAAWVAWVTLGFVGLGVGLRVVRYLLNFPLWCDESMLAANFVDRGFADMLRPLEHRQVSPLLFRMIELMAVRGLGFSELSLRFFPFLCGVASVPLFRHLGGRVLGGVPLLLAVATFAVSGWPLRYAAEVKPYASDLFVALTFLTLAVEWCRKPERGGWLWVLAAFGPLAVALSFPAIFVAGGVGLALAPLVWRSARWDVRIAYVIFGLGVLTTFVLLLGFYRTAPQDQAYFYHDWARAFPPLDSAWALLVWFFAMNTGFMFAYPEGGANGASSLTFLCFVVAAVVLWRRRRRTVLGIFLWPFGLALIAAAVRRYPYGLSARTMQYTAPAICLLGGLGAATLLGRIVSARARRNLLRGLVAVLACLGLGHGAYDISHPYKTPSDERARAFARWFWTEKALDAELACLKGDLGTVFRAEHWGKDATDTYLCYQKIYSPRHHRGDKIHLEAVTETRPLRCVLYNELPQETPAFQAWMADMLTRYRLQKFETYPVSTLERTKGQTWDSLYLVYEFVPRQDSAPPLAKGRTEATPRR